MKIWAEIVCGCPVARHLESQLTDVQLHASPNGSPSHHIFTEMSSSSDKLNSETLRSPTSSHEAYFSDQKDIFLKKILNS